MGAANEIPVSRIPNILWLGPYVSESLKATKTMAVATFSYGKEEGSLPNSCCNLGQVVFGYCDGTGTTISYVLRTSVLVV